MPVFVHQWRHEKMFVIAFPPSLFNNFLIQYRWNATNSKSNTCINDFLALNLFFHGSIWQHICPCFFGWFKYNLFRNTPLEQWFQNMAGISLIPNNKICHDSCLPFNSIFWISWLGVSIVQIFDVNGACGACLPFFMKCSIWVIQRRRWRGGFISSGPQTSPEDK